MYKYEDYEKSAEYIKSAAGAELPETAIVLGSGLGGFAEAMEYSVKIKYEDIPNFPKSTAPSHEGAMYIGKRAAALSGRFHTYEGYTMEQASYYVRVLKLLGVKNLILTNAAGGINESFGPGTLMIVTDHIKLVKENPLCGQNIDRFGTRFPDMTAAYTPRLTEIAEKAAAELGIDIKKGVYVYTGGPCYETPAEIRAYRILGADAVGMSTVPEVITARHAGMNVLAVSCITNMAAGVTGEELTEEEVFKTAEAVRESFAALMLKIIDEIDKGGIN